MKYFVYILLGLSVIMAFFNISQVDFSNPFSKNSFIAIIAIVAALCVTTLCLILLTSKRIEQIQKKNN